MGREPLSGPRLGRPRRGQPRRPARRLPRRTWATGLLRLLRAGRRASGATQAAGYCVARQRLRASQYGAAPINSLRVTAAHEFFHAIQFAYDVDEDSGSWRARDLGRGRGLRQDQRQLPVPRQQPDPLPAHLPRLQRRRLPLRVVHLLQFAAENARHHRRPSLLGRRRRQPHLAAGDPAVVGATAWPAFFTTFGSWNTLPLHSYRERARYPRPAWWLRKTLTAAQHHHRLHSVRIAAPRQRRRAAVAGPHPARQQAADGRASTHPTSTGSAALLQRRYRDGRVTHTMIALDRQRQRQHLGAASTAGVSGRWPWSCANTNRSARPRLVPVRAGLR